MQTSRIQKNTGWRLFWQTVIGRAYPRVVGTQRDLSWLFFDIFLPFMSMIGYVFVYRALDAPEEYIGFVVMGGAMTAFWINILWSMSSQLYWEKENGNLALYILSPTSLIAILLGMASGGMLATTVRAVVILIAGSLIFHVQYVLVSFWSLFAVFTLTMIALYGMGMMLASLFLLLNREAWHLANLAQEPIFLVSGFYFPINAFSFWVAVGASIIPLTLGMDAIRQLIFPSGALLGFLSVHLEIIILSALSVFYIIAAFYMLRRMEKAAIREGRLTDRLS
jgi:ABC-2 type transport system permease protein